MLGLRLVPIVENEKHDVHNTYITQCSPLSHWPFLDAAWKLNCSSVLTTDTVPVKRLYCCVTHFHFPAAIDYNVAMTFILNNNNNNNNSDKYSKLILSTRNRCIVMYICKVIFINASLSRRSGMDHTGSHTNNTIPAVYFRTRSPDGATTNCNERHLVAYYYSYINSERIKGWVGLVSWPIADGLPTMVTCQL